MNGYSALSQSIIAAAMLLFGVNFSIYYLLLTREAKQAFKDEELRWYLAIVLLAVGAIVINVKGMFPSFWAAVHHVFLPFLPSSPPRDMPRWTLTCGRNFPGGYCCC